MTRLSEAKSHGFSLIEVVVVMGIAAIVGLAFVGIIASSNGLLFQQAARVDQGLSINQSTEQLSLAIREASSVVAQYPISGTPQYTTSSTVLVLALPSIDASGNVIDEISDYLIIARDNQNNRILRKIVYPHASSNRAPENRVLTSRLSLISFLYSDNNGNPVSPTSASRIEFIINQLEKASIGNEESSVSGTVNLRNN